MTARRSSIVSCKASSCLVFVLICLYGSASSACTLCQSTTVQSFIRYHTLQDSRQNMADAKLSHVVCAISERNAHDRRQLKK